jgi:ATP-dependent DNA helicase RecG
MPLVQVKGFIRGYYTEDRGRETFGCRFRDETGIIKLIWFKGTKWIMGTYVPGVEYIVFGKPGVFNGIVNIIHPEIEASEKASTRISSALQAQYNTTEKLKSQFITSKPLAS